jgi:hypothetical protein
MSRESREARRRLETGIERSLRFVQAGHEAGKYSAQDVQDFQRHTRKTLRQEMSMDEYAEGRKNGGLDLLLEDLGYDHGEEPSAVDARAEAFAKRALADAASAMWERELLSDDRYMEEMANADALPPDIVKMVRDGKFDDAAAEAFLNHHDPSTPPGPKPDLERPTDTEVKAFKERQGAWEREREEGDRERNKPPKPSEEKPVTLANPWDTPKDSDKPTGTDRGDGMSVIRKVMSAGEGAQAQAAGEGLAGAQG